jgi:ABC-type amino acid transport system permease subunit
MKLRYLQTIMSTDIVQVTNNKEDFSHRALQIYLEVTIPFMVLTFGAWRVLYVLTRRRGRNTEKEKGRRVASGDYSMV